MASITHVDRLKLGQFWKPIGFGSQSHIQSPSFIVDKLPRKWKHRLAAAAAAAATERSGQNEHSNHNIEQFVAQLTACNDERQAEIAAAAAAAADEQREQNEQSNHDIEQVAQLTASNDKIVELKLLL